MSGKTSIEWAEHTWNPVAGCDIVSKGCTNCYAMRMAARVSAMAKSQGRTSLYDGLTMPSKAGAVWNGKTAVADDKTLRTPLRRRKPTIYFVNSMGDLFHEGISVADIDRVFAVMALSPHHTFKVLTKRPARMADFISEGWPLPNVQLGVSVEDQASADARIPDLLATPAMFRFISYEPALGPVDFRRIKRSGGPERANGEFDSLSGHWRTGAKDISLRRGGDTPLDEIIMGGESGKGARPMEADWARNVRDDCADAEVAFFFKQWGGVNKKAAGRLLDGVEHNGLRDAR